MWEVCAVALCATERGMTLWTDCCVGPSALFMPSLLTSSAPVEQPALPMSSVGGY